MRRALLKLLIYDQQIDFVKPYIHSFCYCNFWKPGTTAIQILGCFVSILTQSGWNCKDSPQNSLNSILFLWQLFSLHILHLRFVKCVSFTCRHVFKQANDNKYHLTSSTSSSVIWSRHLGSVCGSKSLGH